MTARKQFLTVYDRGRRMGSRSLTLFGLHNSLDTSRLGITVTRKVGSAAHRNRIKRILREVFRRHRRELPTDLDVVVNAHPSMRGRSLAEIEQEFMSTFSRLAKSVRTAPPSGTK